MFFSLIFMILIWIFVLFLVFGFVHYLGFDIFPDCSKQKESDSALKILRERYAKGEINKEEYEERKKTLEF